MTKRRPRLAGTSAAYYYRDEAARMAAAHAARPDAPPPSGSWSRPRPGRVAVGGRPVPFTPPPIPGLPLGRGTATALPGSLLDRMLRRER